MYDVYFYDKTESPFKRLPPQRIVMRNLKADSVKHLRKFFKEAQKTESETFKNLVINEIKKVSD